MTIANSKSAILADCNATQVRRAPLQLQCKSSFKERVLSQPFAAGSQTQQHQQCLGLVLLSSIPINIVMEHDEFLKELQIPCKTQKYVVGGTLKMEKEPLSLSLQE
jgi:hypothetical protein